jgi:hypothetical protein
MSGTRRSSPSTSGCLQSEFVYLLFLQGHQETESVSLTVFLQLEEFILHNLPVDSSTSSSTFDVLFTGQKQSGQHPRQGDSFTYQLEILI